MIGAVIFFQRVFDIDMIGKRAIEHPAAIGAGAIVLHGFLACINHIRIEGHAHIIVSAEQDRLFSADHGFGW